MSTADFLDLGAVVDNEEEDAEFDEETGEARESKANGVDAQLEDSSEEEDEDDEEEAARVREGFIDDEDELEDAAERRRRRKERKKRRREEREREDEGLDEEDLDLIGELPERPSGEPTFKRLKRGHREERARERGVDDIFSDEEEENLRPGPATSRNALAGEFDDFIEEDEPDEGEGEQEDHEVMVGRTKRGLEALRGLDAGLDEAAIEDMRAAFGDGTEYDWALDLQEDMDIGELDPDKPIELKDVFEPSQLKEKMLTEEDNLIRATDVPERIQLARKGFPEEDLDEQQLAARHAEEAEWISGRLWPKKRMTLGHNYLVPFKKAIGHVLGFMNVNNFEVPFIFQHRKDYLIHSVGRNEDDPDAEQINGDKSDLDAKKLLSQPDLWVIFDLDLKYRGLIQKRKALQKLYENIKSITARPDEIIEVLLPTAIEAEEIGDLQEYMNFQYATEIRDATLRESTNGQKRSRTVTSLFERLRVARGYRVVRGFGTTADSFANVVLNGAQRGYTEDPEFEPNDMADQYTDESFPTGSQVLKAAKMMFAEELAMSPRMRKFFRDQYYATGQFDCFRTAKGLKQIDEDSSNYEFKYLRNQDIYSMSQRPDLFLRMLKAEAEGLVEVHITLGDREQFHQKLKSSLESDNFSDVADSWNALRREALAMAIARLHKIIVKGVKEAVKTECENDIAKICREEYGRKLDQAPYKPRGMDPGVVARVVTMTLSRSRNNEVHFVWMDEDGRISGRGIFQLQELRVGNEEKGIPDGSDVERLRAVLERRPDLVAISGYNPDIRSLYKTVQDVITKYDIKGDEHYDDQNDEEDEPRDDQLEVRIVDDDVARLYSISPRAETEFPSSDQATRYCIALARYLQNPLKEYANLGSDVLSITFASHQNLVPKEKLQKTLETALVDMVNIVGVEINDAIQDPHTVTLLQYICGLGPRKATSLYQAISRTGGSITTRLDLLGDPETGTQQIVGPKVFENCASFLYIKYDPTEPGQNYLDNTRTHPEDYELAKKMVGDALDMDEEDVKSEQDEYGEFAVVRKMLKEDRRHEVNSLVLELYAEQLETQLSQRKRATLETIRAELVDPYEELRQGFMLPTSEEIFTMLTGETRESLCEGMVIPVVVRKGFPDHLEVRLDCGIEGGVPEAEYPSGVTDPRSTFRPHQTLQAKVLSLSRKQLTAQLTLKEDAVRRPYKKEVDKAPGAWDFVQEENDKRDAVKEKETVTGRPQRVIKHPLFKAFNSAQAEEYLGPQSRGDVVIRPSSNGMDHLAVTWKVSNNVFQHIDVLELDKENEFSVGKTLKIGRYTYSDLDELIVNHVKAMVKKVEEIMADERFQRGSKTQAGTLKSSLIPQLITMLTISTEQWLTAYMEANPKRSMYAFCINPQFPGYFHLCFKPTPQSNHMSWPIKVIPQAFELQKNPYPDMRALKNGFKTLIMKQQTQQRRY